MDTNRHEMKVMILERPLSPKHFAHWAVNPPSGDNKSRTRTRTRTRTSFMVRLEKTPEFAP